MKMLLFLPLMLRRDIHNLEYDAETQYRFHRFWAAFWFLTMIAVPFIPKMRAELPALLIMEASLWANFATHFGGMSAALAAKVDPPQVIEIEKTQHDHIVAAFDYS